MLAIIIGWSAGLGLSDILQSRGMHLVSAARRIFPLMPKPKSKASTRIRAEVIRLVGLIPGGKFTTYGSIAVHMNVAPLFVASVLASLTPEESDALPWHRVVSSDGRLSPNMDKKLARLQRRRLESEGLKINRAGFIADSDAHFHVVGIRRNIRWSEG